MSDVSDQDPIIKDRNLTDRTHNDPDRHWIGETLPAPSDAETTFAGALTSAGASVFPARADHSHDHRTKWGGFKSSDTATGKSVAAATSNYLDDLTFTWGPDNLLYAGSNQLIDFPQEGVWQIHHRLTITRSTGTFPANTYFVVEYRFNNAAVAHTMEQNLVPEGRVDMRLNIVDIAYYASVSATSNLQINVTNSDAVSWNFRTFQLDVRRLSSFQGAGEL
jgi:hypothetical protein